MIFETPPPLKKGYFGTSVEEKEQGNFVRQNIGNWLPTPDQGLFQPSNRRLSRTASKIALRYRGRVLALSPWATCVPG